MLKSLEQIEMPSLHLEQGYFILARRPKEVQLLAFPFSHRFSEPI